MPLGMMYLLRGMNTLHCSISKHKKTNKSKLSKLRAILPKKGKKKKPGSIHQNVNVKKQHKD